MQRDVLATPDPDAELQSFDAIWSRRYGAPAEYVT
jgi:hypothetical protein